MMTKDQELVIEQAILRGLVKNHTEAHEAGCAALRNQLLELQEEDNAKRAAAARAEAEAVASNPFSFV